VLKVIDNMAFIEPSDHQHEKTGAQGRHSIAQKKAARFGDLLVWLSISLFDLH
jgi:hypothetical protein